MLSKICLKDEDEMNINIAFSCNNAWVDKLATVIVEILLKSNKNDKYCFYILDGGISPENKSKLSKIKSKTTFEINYIAIDKSSFKDAPLNNHFTIEAYFRLKLPSLLKVDKLLYLDVDIIVRKNIAKIYDESVENVYAAVVTDSLASVASIHKLPLKRYFNSGVLLLNLKKIRDENLELKFFDFIKNHSDKITYVDQCVLNAVFNDNVRYLPITYNFQHSDICLGVLKQYKKFKNDIVVLHFVTARKPWNFDKSWNFIIEYYYYFLKTPFKVEFFKNICFIVAKKLRLTYLLLFSN